MQPNYGNLWFYSIVSNQSSMLLLELPVKHHSRYRTPLLCIFISLNIYFRLTAWFSLCITIILSEFLSPFKYIKFAECSTTVPALVLWLLVATFLKQTLHAKCLDEQSGIGYSEPSQVISHKCCRWKSQNNAVGVSECWLGLWWASMLIMFKAVQYHDLDR